jgi:Ca-activated chloride channel homolog
VYKSDVLRLLVLIALCGAAEAGSLSRAPGLYTTTAKPAALPMLDSKIDVRIRGPIVETTITQTFKNPSDDATEATYIFPLPADAAVSAMAMDLGTRTIRASVEKREQAQARYEEAVAHGLGAGLLEEERPDVFTQTVSAIPGRGTVVVTLRYDTTAHYADGTWELVVPLVVAPRYTPGTASGRPTTGSGRNPDTDRSPDASRVTPHSSPGAGGSSTISIDFATTVESVTSPTHTLDHNTVVDPNSDRDLIVRWRDKLPAEGWVESDGYAAVLVTGPAATPHTATKCRFIFDRSATIRGDGDNVERPLARALLGALDTKDRAGLQTGELHAPADIQHALDDAWDKSNAVFDLTTILASTHPDGPIILVTAGLVSDDAAAIAAAKKLGVPLHVIGIGAAPNRSLLAALAAETGGTARYAIAGDDLKAIATDVISDAANPPVALAVSWGTLKASDAVPAHLPRVGAGQAQLVIAKVAEVHTANARARNDVLALASFTAPAAPTGATTTHGPIARRWARIRLDELLAAGNPRAITAHALAWGLLSPYTAMVALGDEVIVSGGVKHTRGVPVSLPAGMRWQPVKRETTVDTTIANGADAAKAEPPAKHKKKQREDDEDDDKNDKPHNAKKRPVTTSEAPPMAPPTNKPAADTDESGDDDGVSDRKKAKSFDAAPEEPVSVTGVTTEDTEDMQASETAYETPHYLRLDVALGGGISIVNRTAAFVATARVGVSRGMFGGEGSLWISPTNNSVVEGTALGTLRLHHRLIDLQLGVGIHLGSHVGPAIMLQLDYNLSGKFSIYVRYDGALVFHDSTRDGENTATFGIAAHF